MQKSGLASLAIFYYDFREDEKKDLRGLLSSVLFQLCNHSDSYYDILSLFYSAHCDGAQSPGDDKLVRCLKDVLSLPGQAPVGVVLQICVSFEGSRAVGTKRSEVASTVSGLSARGSEVLRSWGSNFHFSLAY